MSGFTGDCKKILIVVSHPEPQSFNHGMASTMQKAFESKGIEVRVSDLHAMKWDPINDRRNTTTTKQAEKWIQANEEIYASSRDGFNPAIKAEMDKVMWCDMLIFQFPIHWFGLPAMLKSWVDKVFAFGVTYSTGKWYGSGLFKDKKAMLSLSTGAPEFLYKYDSVQGEMNSILYPIYHGIFYFCGFQCVKPFITYSPGLISPEARAAELARLDAYVRTFPDVEMIQYLGVEDCDKAPEPSHVPVEAADMISICNILMKAWTNNDGDLYREFISNGFKMHIPAYGVDVTGFDAVWSIRSSMGSDALDPHVCDSHSFLSPLEIQCYVHILSKETGKRVQLSEVVFRFDEKNPTKVAHYHQENLFVEADK